MNCPDDGTSLIETRAGIWSCRACRGHAVAGETFSTLHRDVRPMLQPEPDRSSGAYAHIRPCPRCRGAMIPLRIGDQLAWLDRCELCEVLWVERPDEAVIRRLEGRRALTEAVESLDSEERRAVARDIAGEVATHHRQIRVLRTLSRLLHDLTGW